MKTRDQEEPDLDDQLSDASFQEPNNQTETVVHEDNNLCTLQEEVKKEFVQKGTTVKGTATVVRRSKRVRMTIVPTDADDENIVPSSSGHGIG